MKHVQKRGKYHKKRKSQPEFKLHNEKVKFYGQLLGYGVKIMNLASVGVLVGITTFRQLILIGQVGLVVHIKLLSNFKFVCYNIYLLYRSSVCNHQCNINVIQWM